MSAYSTSGPQSTLIYLFCFTVFITDMNGLYIWDNVIIFIVIMFCLYLYLCLLGFYLVENLL